MPDITRRSALGAIIAAPIAAPVAAREAAKKMQLASALTNPSLNEGLVGSTPPSQSAQVVAMDDVTWAKEMLAKIDSIEAQKELRQQARYDARILDADLASSRAMSPAAAYTIQAERCYKQRREDSRSYYLKFLKPKSR